ncbi:MAG: hypothetical protein DA408_19345 [Bacteroidetes bacterium]|nr:MAG: hypothetical protein C7N36_08070 [Bacteroidota bacterium]PTM08981.1 MAG: hypothetical protein DA408_19345 [Bacteroidota bacterium]
MLNLTIRTAENTGIFIPDPNHTSWFLAPGDAFFRIAIISQPHKGSHGDILVHFPFLQRLLVVDSYYYALAFEFLGKLETKTVQQNLEEHFAEYVSRLNALLSDAKSNDCIYCAFDLSDEYSAGIFFTQKDNAVWEVVIGSIRNHSGDIFPQLLGSPWIESVQPVVVTHFALEGTNRLLIPVILDVAVVDSAELSVCF